MANKLHADLVDADGIHEPKDISSANAGEIYIADGAGSGAWGPGTFDDSFEPTVTSYSGSITTASATSRVKKIGSLVFFTIDLTITTNGTGATYVLTDLPYAPVGYQVVVGTEHAVTGKIVQGSVSGSNLYLAFADGSYPGGDNYHITVSGVYETNE